METEADATPPLEDTGVIIITQFVLSMLLHLNKDDVPTSLVRGPLELVYWERVNRLFNNPLKLRKYILCWVG